MTHLPILPKKGLEESVTQPSTILIIDDNADNRLLLGSQLNMHGYNILEAETPIEGLELAKNELPDLILLDVMMPIMNGFEVCQRLKSDPETQLIPVIMVTALRDLEYRIQGIDVGADEFLTRPHNKEELIVRSRALIRLRKAQLNLQAERNRLRLLHEVNRAVNDTGLDLTQTLNEVMFGTKQVFSATRGNLFLLSTDGSLVNRIVIREDGQIEHIDNVNQQVFHEGLAGWAIENQTSIIVDDTQTDSRWLKLPDDVGDVGSAVATPLSSRVATEGVLVLMHRNPNHFQEADISLLETVAGQIAVAIRNATLFREMNEQRKRMEVILAQSSEAIIVLSEDKKIELINRAASRAFGSDISNHVGSHIKDVPQLNIILPLFSAQRESHQSIELHVPPDRFYFASITPIHNVGYMLFMQDISLRKREEERRLEEAHIKNQQLHETFSRYMSPRVVDQMIEHPEKMYERKKQDVVVLFADLRGSIKMILSQTPENSIEILNEFFEKMTAIVYRMDGTIFDLAGDELMIGFNAPLEQEDATQKAVETAIQMQVLFESLRTKWDEVYDVLLGLGIGIDRGQVVMGNVGAAKRLNFALVGEAVHTAHRLVDIAADGEIVVSDSVYQSGDLNLSEGIPSNHDDLKFEALGYTHLKGKLKPEQIYKAVVLRSQ